MDTVWTTVKVRRSLLGKVADLRPGTSNAQLVEQALRRALERETEGSGPRERSRPESHLPSPVRASNERADGETGAGTASHRPSPSSTIPEQATVDEMLASCPQCAGEMHVVDISRGGQVIAQNAMGCLDCGFVREPEGT
jgi:hypothetical protein